jgi:molecular chaperone GrpE
MREVDEALDTSSGSVNPAHLPAAEEASPSLTDELELATIEGLAEEETPPPHVSRGCPTVGEGTPVAPTDPSVVLDAIQGLGERLNRRIDSLQTLLERELRAEATRERVVDRLHAELQEYKQDLLLKVQRPIFVDLIQLHDDIGKMIDARPPEEIEPGDATAVRCLLDSIQTAIEDILYRQGVEPFAMEGQGFDPRNQRAVATRATEDPDLDKTIANRLRKGFRAGEKLIRPEIVSVFTLTRRSTPMPLPAASPGETRPAPTATTGS